MRELDLCAASMMVLTQTPQGLAASERDIGRQCVHLREADACVRNYTQRCMSPPHSYMIQMAIEPSLGMLKDYCTTGSQLQTQYLKHAQCFRQVHKSDGAKCARDLQAAVEQIAADTTSKKASAIASIMRSGNLQLSCCARRRFDSCIYGAIERKCGKPARRFVRGLMRQAMSRLPDNLCAQYRPDGAECRAALPKAGAPLKGAKSSSIVARVMSAYLGAR